MAERSWFCGGVSGPGYMSRKFESFERINSIRETNGNFDSCNSCKRLIPSRLDELHESKFVFASLIEFICSKLSDFLLMYPESAIICHAGLRSDPSSR